MGYRFRDIPGLTWTEINTLLLGYVVNEEAKADAGTPAAGSPSSQRVREHKQSIRQRLHQS
jgi:hypothetical protein